MQIKVGYLAAYDYELLKHSIPTVYEHADKIVIAMDKNRLTFSGQLFQVGSHFFDWLNEVDKRQKITLYEDEFYQPGLTPMEVDTRQRNLLAKYMGEGGWHLQVDADEYFIDFKKLVDKLRSFGRRYDGRKVSFRVYLSTIFKIADGGYYVVDGSSENFPLATNYPHYREARYPFSDHTIFLNHVVLHQSFGRTYEELETKFRNWGHRDDFDSESYLRFWKSVNKDNYKYFGEFNATHPWFWKKLKFVEATSIEELLRRTPAHYERPPRMSGPFWAKWVPPVIRHRITKWSGVRRAQ